MTETRWITLRIHPWDALRSGDGSPAQIVTTPATPIAWCGVFADRAAALAWVDGNEALIYPVQIDPDALIVRGPR